MTKTKTPKKFYFGQGLHKVKKLRLVLLGSLLVVAAAVGTVLLRAAQPTVADVEYSCPGNPHPTLRRGVRNPACVYHLQRALNVLLRDGRFSLAHDGDFGPKTQRAVVEFQKRARIAQDGVVGPTTWTNIYFAGCEGKQGDKYGLGYRANGNPYVITRYGMLSQQRGLSSADCRRLYF